MERGQECPLPNPLPGGEGTRTPPPVPSPFGRGLGRGFFPSAITPPIIWRGDKNTLSLTLSQGERGQERRLWFPLPLGEG
ncbi:protein of unknown function [Candidatus Promineifilum breve]|uniref:Uncharacterized protein n=1 Tax=Candidatus Promineifilum breve TaxID=1806508 RepID=A0A160T0R0_9CHLR|nr:protein of unknown function [Candidatus Promineifilum breve]